MKITAVIESKQWLNKKTGQTASVTGSVPYGSEAESLDWSIVTRGWTWLLDNGTRGLGRPPAKTYAEALEVMNQFNGRSL